MRVLIADDNRDILETTQMVLELDGHDVRLVEASSEIEAQLADFQPDVLMQDVNMPGLDLPALLDRLVDTRVLLFSGSPPGAELLEHPAVVGFVPKPFVIAALREHLAQLQ